MTGPLTRLAARPTRLPHTLLLIPAFTLGLLTPVRAQTTPASTAPAAVEAPAVETGLVAELRAARKNAWLHRMAGDLEMAVRVAEDAIARTDAALASDVDSSTRRELTGLRASISGLRDAARADLDARNGKSPGAAEGKSFGTIEPQMNPDVVRWVDHFTGAGRSTFERWLRRSGRYVDLFRTVLQNEGLPPDLVHLVFVESGFNVHARSVSAAVGPWQFLRSTARYFGLTVDQWVDERKDPEKSTVAAARYLKHLYSAFGDWPLALASYNAGEGTVMRAIKRQGTHNYWDLRLPRETENYVPQFMAVLAISRDPARYGFDEVVKEEPMDFDEVALKGSVDMRAMARLIDCPFEEMQRLNPQVLRQAARGPDGVTTLRVPRGKGELLTRALAERPLPAVPVSVTHKVRAGETLSGIAARYQMSTQALAQMNDIGPKKFLRRGQVLQVGGRAAPRGAVALVDAADPRASTDYVPDTKVRPLRPVAGDSDPGGRYTVTVRRGESLAAIAAANNVSTSDIKRWNRLTSTAVKPGQRLKIRSTDASEPGEDDVITAEEIQAAEIPAAAAPEKAVKAKKKKKSAGATRVKVRRGDTLSDIARRHGVSVSALRRANRLKSDRIQSGQQLRLPAG